MDSTTYLALRRVMCRDDYTSSGDLVKVIASQQALGSAFDDVPKEEYDPGRMII
jgi:hypothetical protein